MLTTILLSLATFAAACAAAALYAARQARKTRQQSAALTDRIRNARSELQAAVDELTATAEPPTEAPPALIDVYRKAIRADFTPASRSTRPPGLRLVRVQAFPYRGGHNDVCAYAAGIGRYCTCHTKDQP